MVLLTRLCRGGNWIFNEKEGLIFLKIKITVDIPSGEFCKNCQFKTVGSGESDYCSLYTENLESECYDCKNNFQCIDCSIYKETVLGPLGTKKCEPCLVAIKKIEQEAEAIARTRKHGFNKKHICSQTLKSIINKNEI